MKRILTIGSIGCLLALTICLSGCQKKDTFEGGGKVIANINGNKITEEKLKMMIQSLPPNSQAQFQTDEGKKNLIDQITTQTLLVQYAHELKLDQDPQFLIRKELMNDQLLLNQYYQHVMKTNEATDEALQKFYDTHPEVMGGKMTYHARHIILTPKKDAKIFNTSNTDAKTDKEALAEIAMIQKKLKDGASFEDLAQKYSEGPSAPRGGDLGSFQKGDMVPEFETALDKLEPGQVSDVIKTRFGYHLVKLISKGEPQRKPFDQLSQKEKEQLKGEFYRGIVNQRIEDLKKKAAIEVNI